MKTLTPRFVPCQAGMNGGMDYLCGRLVYYDGLHTAIEPVQF